MPISLRPLEASDLAIFFDQQRDPLAVHMVAFASRDPNDRDAFVAHWTRTSALPTVVHRTILARGRAFAEARGNEEIEEIRYELP